MNKQLKQLSKRQINDLVAFVSEDCGTDLSRQSFEESLLLMLEGVSGLENIKPEQQKVLVETAYSLYIKPTQ